jgi:prepilin-type N-terminal cleavage/methylation domain-containing protein/prepilin-type processing-associated H-X9-DG protein
MKLSLRRHRRIRAFTLVELIVVICIIALMASLAAPSYRLMILRAQSVSCASNLRAIGVAVNLAATDNSGHYPEIDQAATPVYPTGSGAQGLVPTLTAYGITSNSIQCPVDISLGSSSAFKVYGSSYEWSPVFDDGTDPTTSIDLGVIQIPVNSSRVRLCTDFNRLHSNNTKMNALYGDGHVTAR